MKTIRVDKMGLTAIEVVLIIIIVFVLSAIAIPRFINPIGKAQQKTVDNTAVSLTHAAIINDEACKHEPHHKESAKCLRITKCSDVAQALTPPIRLGIPGEALRDTYNLAVDLSVVKNGDKATCTLQIKKLGVLYSATYVVTGAGN